MKKILSVLILTILTIGLIAPLGVLAQKEKLKECCLIHQKMNWTVGKIDMGCDEDNCTIPAQPCIKGAGNLCVLVPKDANNNIQGIGPRIGTACPGLGDPNDATDDFVTYVSDQWGMICIINTITNVTNWIFYLMMVAVVIVFVIAAAWFMLAGGDVEKTAKAKGLMILGVVGLVIALVAKLIPSVVKLIVGM